MQTFLPYPDFAASAACLDDRRLGKQRVEAYQILRALTIPGYGWQRHPAVMMWRGYEDALRQYMNACIEEWERRGFRNGVERAPVREPVEPPPWLGNPDFHAAHRSNLLRKDAAFYRRYGWQEPPDLPYVWPVMVERARRAAPKRQIVTAALDQGNPGDALFVAEQINEALTPPFELDAG